MTLRRRVLAYVAGAALASCALTVLVGTALVRHQISARRVTALERVADVLATVGVLPGALGPGLHVYSAGSGTPRQLGSARAERVLAAVPVTKNAEGTVNIQGRDILFAERSTPSGQVVVVRPAAFAFSEWRPFLGSLLLAGLGGALVAALLSFLLARRLTRPIAELSAATGRLAAGERDVLVPVRGEDELADLGTAFNAMSGELGRAREAQRSFLESVSHELKTPLTSIRGYAEAVQEGAVSPPEGTRVIAAEADRLERLVGDLSTSPASAARNPPPSRARLRGRRRGGLLCADRARRHGARPPPDLDRRVTALERVADVLATVSVLPGALGPGLHVYTAGSGTPRQLGSARADRVLAAVPVTKNAEGTVNIQGRDILFAERSTPRVRWWSCAGGIRLLRVAAVPRQPAARGARRGARRGAPVLPARPTADPPDRRAVGRHRPAGRRRARCAGPVRGEDELADLGTAFNAMSGELGRAREAQRSFLESVSHELKTPLTSIRGYAEAVQEGAVSPPEGTRVIAAEADRLERLVGDLSTSPASAARTSRSSTTGSIWPMSSGERSSVIALARRSSPWPSLPPAPSAATAPGRSAMPIGSCRRPRT